MNTGKTLFAQLMDFLPWITFTRIVDRYGGDHRVRTLSCAEQYRSMAFVDRYGGDHRVRTLSCAEQYRSMAFAQLTYRESLRDIETCLSVHASKLYHMGFRQPVRRSTLADANERRDWRIHAALAQRLITQARTLYVDEELGLDLTKAEVHWRAFLETLVARGMRGVAYIVSDDHPGLGAARKAVLGGAVWQRCQYHLAQNAIHHAPNLAIRKAIGKELRRVWNAADGKAAEAELGHLVAAYRDSAPKLADWLETAIPEGLAVFALPERHQKRMRTSNPMERSIQQEIKRRTVKVRVFPNEASLERLVTAILVEIDEKWETTEKPYITWKAEDD